MSQYMLSVHTSREGEAQPPMSEQQMQQFMQNINALEQEMKAEGAWVFSARLHGPDTATVVRLSDGEVLTTDGPFAEAREHIAGFYIIEAPDLDAAMRWAAKVTECVGRPIEVRPFFATKS